jgi:hypothetical protein
VCSGTASAPSREVDEPTKRGQSTTGGVRMVLMARLNGSIVCEWVTGAGLGRGGCEGLSHVQVVGGIDLGISCNKCAQQRGRIRT